MVVRARPRGVARRLAFHRPDARRVGTVRRAFARRTGAPAVAARRPADYRRVAVGHRVRALHALLRAHVRAARAPRDALPGQGNPLPACVRSRTLTANPASISKPRRWGRRGGRAGEELAAALRWISNVHRPNGLPNVCIVSAPRSGSTWLLELVLSQPGFKPCNEPFNLRK